MASVRIPRWHARHFSVSGFVGARDPVGAGTDLGLIWLVADTLNAFMAIPNLIALFPLSPVVFQLSRAISGERG